MKIISHTAAPAVAELVRLEPGKFQDLTEKWCEVWINNIYASAYLQVSAVTTSLLYSVGQKYSGEWGKILVDPTQTLIPSTTYVKEDLFSNPRHSWRSYHLILASMHAFSCSTTFRATIDSHNRNRNKLRIERPTLWMALLKIHRSYLEICSRLCPDK